MLQMTPDEIRGKVINTVGEQEFEWWKDIYGWWNLQQIIADRATEHAAREIHQFVKDHQELVDDWQDRNCDEFVKRYGKVEGWGNRSPDRCSETMSFAVTRKRG